MINVVVAVAVVTITAIITDVTLKFSSFTIILVSIISQMLLTCLAKKI